MRLPLPETLFGRLFAATVAVVALALLVLISIVLRERREIHRKRHRVAAIDAVAFE